MIVGCPKEIKQDEYRVAIVPAGVEELRKHGHRVLVQAGAGVGSGISDAEYRKAGATMVKDPRAIFDKAGLIVKVKEPLESEWPMIRPGSTLFTYFHFAASRKLTRAMLSSGATCIAYETVRTEDGRHPLLTPMSEVAGRMSIQEGAKYLERPQEGRGILLAGVPGVEPADVVIIGGGIVGANAAKIAAGLRARVTVLDINLERLRYLDDVMPPNVRTVMSNAYTIRDCIRAADLLVSAAPTLVTRKDLKLMKDGAVVVDVAIDQGGSLETSRPTTHSKPTYIVEGVVHYCVTNMPGAVGRTSTYALTNVTLPYALELADMGMDAAARDPALRRGINIMDGKVTIQAVAETFRMKWTDPADCL